MRRLTWVVGIAIVCGAAAYLLPATKMTETSYDNHFDGNRFYNVPPRDQVGFGSILKWMATRETGPWQEMATAEPGPPPPASVSVGAARVTFVNHATVLIQIDGLNILTDPTYDDRASPVSFAGPKRMRPPGIRFEDLPNIDAVVVSHNHYDHMNLKTLKRLFERDRPVMFVGLRNKELLVDSGILDVEEFDWWESQQLNENVSLTFVPAQHFSGRSLFDRNRTLWGGYYVRGTKHGVYFAGDTGAGRHFSDIRDRLGAPDLALLPIGAFLPPKIMKPVHLNPEEAVEAHLQVGAAHSMAIHFGTFPLADDGQWEPVERLDEALNARNLTREDFWVLDFGEGREVSSMIDE